MTPRRETLENIVANQLKAAKKKRDFGIHPEDFEMAEAHERVAKMTQDVIQQAFPSRDPREPRTYEAL